MDGWPTHHGRPYYISMTISYVEGDLEKVGQCMDRYWVLKRSMATGCEPAICRQMMDVLRPYVHGTCMAGAGGGGFMYVLAKEPNSIENIREVLSKVEVRKRVKSVPRDHYLIYLHTGNVHVLKKCEN